LKDSKKPSQTIPLILLVSKLQLGRLVREPLALNTAKKLFPTVEMLLVSKLHVGRLVREPPWLNTAKKLSPTFVAPLPK